ncbi:MAG: hypothetical protein DRI79_05180 [Chloroflexi bacterium]|nr:MAG: hypothetical protein DRI79_05180 [Chloroflexota bacterium]
MLRPDPTVPALGVALMGTLVTSWLERDFLPSRRTGEVLSVAMLSALILLVVWLCVVCVPILPRADIG